MAFCYFSELLGSSEHPIILPLFMLIGDGDADGVKIFCCCFEAVVNLQREDILHNLHIKNGLLALEAR